MTALKRTWLVLWYFVFTIFFLALIPVLIPARVVWDVCRAVWLALIDESRDVWVIVRFEIWRDFADSWRRK